MSLLIAVFNQTTGWSGRTITYEEAQRQFTLQDHGPITAQDVLGYDVQGQLDWAREELREWVRDFAEWEGGSSPQTQAADPLSSESAGSSGEAIAALQAEPAETQEAARQQLVEALRLAQTASDRERQGAGTSRTSPPVVRARAKDGGRLLTKDEEAALSVLVFDTETTGLPARWNAPMSDVASWPRLVQLGWVVCDGGFEPKCEAEMIVYPEGYRIPRGAKRIHGISTRRARKYGVPLQEALATFAATLGECRVVAAHNLDFDRNVLGAEYLRAGIRDPFRNVARFCTMKYGTNRLCRLTPRHYGEYKWPTLGELHEFCCGETLRGAHGALGDARAVARCIAELKARGLLQLREDRGRYTVLLAKGPKRPLHA
jgi:DNA polymerase-3 subunit epsilon